MAPQKSPDICKVCKEIIPINERSTRREICKECEKKMHNSRKIGPSKEILQKRLRRKQKYDSFVKEYKNIDNWQPMITKISRKLNIPISTIYDYAKRYEMKNHLNDIMNEGDPDGTAKD